MLLNDKVLILDCTLRDGGYVNNWEFDTNTALSVINSLYDSGVRIIELGLMAKGGVPGVNTKFLTFNQIEPLLYNRKKDCHYAVMLTQAEYKAVEFEIPECSDKTPDIIRLAFFKLEMEEALKTAGLLKSKGYKVFLQAMATFLYSDSELLHLVDEVNLLKPESFYMVDSFSTMYNEDVKKMQDLIYTRLDKDILFGFHAHNNIQMAYSNIIEFIKNSGERQCIIDGSIYGMGRGAGNVPVELIMEYLNKKFNKNYNIQAVLNCFEKNIQPIFNKYYWGYSIPYLLTAIKDVNSVYAWYLSKKGISKISDLNAVLDGIPNDAKYTLMKNIVDKVIENHLSGGRK